MFRQIALASLLAVMATGADAAPNIPSSELPGRARQQFQESPVDRFTQPSTQQRPLFRWDCEPRKSAKGKSRNKRAKRC
ncbi:MAG: hypothetical protein GEU95_09855 [Rhizobiales bacterium]|nr:hypothetical protein [Hyphomicrobiales bacterium]